MSFGNDLTYSSVFFSLSTEKCAEITTPLNGSKIQTTNGTSTLLTFNCDIGFTLIGSSELICLRDGSWSELVPTCGMSFD